MRDSFSKFLHTQQDSNHAVLLQQTWKSLQALREDNPVMINGKSLDIASVVAVVR